MILYMKFKRRKQNKLLLKDTSKCANAQRKARVVHFCLEEGGREKTQGKEIARDLRSIVAFDFSSWVECPMGVHNDRFSL